MRHNRTGPEKENNSALQDTEEARAKHSEKMMLLLTKKFEKFRAQLEKTPQELLRHNDCRLCDGLPGMSNELPKMSPFSLVLLSRDEELVCRTIELVDSCDLWDCARCALFLLVDFCCSKLACFNDEIKLARFFVTLSHRHRDSCVRLLRVELTDESLNPLEYAAAGECFHLAAAFANAPGYLIRELEHPSDPSLLIEEVDLSCYSSAGGDRFLKSPFIQFLRSSKVFVSEAIPSGYCCFFRSPVAQAFFSSLQYRSASSKFAIISLLMYLLMYVSLLSTMTVRIFTKNTFDAEVQVFIPGDGSANSSYLQMIPASMVSGMRYFFYARIAVQVYSLLVWLVWIFANILDYRSNLALVRRRRSAVAIVSEFMTMRGCRVVEAFSIFFVLQQALTLVVEQSFFFVPGSYFERDGKIFVEGTRLQFIILLNYYSLFSLQFFFIADMAVHHQVFLNVLFCLNGAMKLTFLILLPMVTTCTTMLLSQPFIECSVYSWTCALDYLGRSFRYVFSLSGFPGISDYITLWPQVIVFLFVGVFILNFGVALLTQQISLLYENSDIRKTVLSLFWSHQYIVMRNKMSSLLRAPKRHPLMLRRVLSRLRTECDSHGGSCDSNSCCCVRNCEGHSFSVHKPEDKPAVIQFAHL